MKLNAILIALFATAAYAQDGRPNKAQMMALREEMRNAKTYEELMAIREKLKDMHPGIRSKLMKDPRMRDRMPHTDMNDVEFDHKAMRAKPRRLCSQLRILLTPKSVRNYC